MSSTKVIKINKTTPVTVGIIITMVKNYRRDFDEYMLTSKDEGFVSDRLIEDTLVAIEEDLSPLNNGN